MAHPYEEYEGTAIWRALDVAISELEVNQDLQLNTVRKYVIGFLSQSLTSRGLTEGSAMSQRVRHDEDDERVYVHFSASLRIFGDGLDIDGVSATLGLSPTHTHRKGEPRRRSAAVWPHDMWSYKPPVDETRPLDEHITALWDAVRPNLQYLRDLKQRFHVDVFCGYRSNSSTAGFDVDYRCLGLFFELEVPFSVSVIT